ncbi:hypothetical protein TIFTF001_029253 [Ficus carica]|uniref:Uncharacterized protein n=1 Tax=Ficus carica TaxID=3494 RepID=A0AA88J273_FICCA|nr:hypothetical protein TIFTF001_029253 [Ficus carica]
MTLNSEAKVIENLLLRVSKLETTVNDKPRDEVEEVSHSFTAERILIDNDSSVDVLYKDTFPTIILTHEQMVATARCLLVTPLPQKK